MTDFYNLQNLSTFFDKKDTMKSRKKVTFIPKLLFYSLPKILFVIQSN